MPARSSAAVQRVRELYKRWTAAAKRFQRSRLERALARRGGAAWWSGLARGNAL